MPAALRPTCCCRHVGWVASVGAVLVSRVWHLGMHMHSVLLLQPLVLTWLQVVPLLLSLLLSSQHGFLQLKG